MAINWNEIRIRATTFIHEWEGETRERAEAQSFWNDFFAIFGLTRRRVASFEEAVARTGGGTGFIDLFWPGILIVEHKSAGEDLKAAYSQALDYFPGLPEKDLPRYIIVSDFVRFRLYDLDEDKDVTIQLDQLLDRIELFGFIAGYEKRTYEEQDPVNIKAAGQMGLLHDALRDSGYQGHDLEVYLVRLLFCLFADDTGIFAPRGIFLELLQDTRQDGSDLGPLLNQFFEVLNIEEHRRQRALDDRLTAFPYVNGRLFSERLPVAAFNSRMRERLLAASDLDWGAISPAIFGSLFQSVMDPDERRSLGAHYTSEKNIMKLIEPLFMDELWDELDKAGRNKRRLNELHQRIARFRLFDPACGCGNFLVVAYRELRRLELEILKRLYGGSDWVLNIDDLVRVNVNQCFGIEIEEFPAQIAQVALWLVDHQMNVEVATFFGQYFNRLPLVTRPNITNGNALKLDWNTCFGDEQPESFNVILGNPPFVGAKYQTSEQKKDMKRVFGKTPGAGLLDFVAAWYLLAARYMKEHPNTVSAFVSTNSISQGEQVGVLWNKLFGDYGAKIHFAHRTFQWTNEAAGKAAVHVVIIGFGLVEVDRKRLFEYENVTGEPHERQVSNINPYLVDGPNAVVLRRSEPISPVPRIAIGNKPIDGGHYLFSKSEMEEFVAREPEAAPYFRPWLGAQEFLNGNERWCLWLGDARPHELRKMPEAMKRVEAVRRVRQESKSRPTQAIASTPTRFHVENMPTSRFLVIPEVSSERRDYIPIGYLSPDVLASNKLRVFPDASLYDFGVLSSAMHMAWMRYTAGRLESRYQYSVTVVYNNFPWPEDVTDKQRKAIEDASQAVLDAREPHLQNGSTLADLYDPLSMPPELVRAHQALDRAVDRAYRAQPFTTETNRVAFLFDRYEELTNALFV